MKKTLSLFIFFAGILITVASCRKSNSGNNSSGTLLSKYIVLDATLSPPVDTEFVVQFAYDNSKRISGFVDIEYDLPVIDTIEKATYYYNGSDTLPYKSVLYENSPDSTDLLSDAVYNYEFGIINGTSTIYYFYSAEKLIEDSAVGYNYTQTNNYDYVNNFVIRNQSSTTNGISNPVYIDTFYQTDQNGNLINQIDTLYRPLTDNIYEGFAYQLDNHPNPLYHKAMTPFAVLQIDGFDSDPQQKNNYTAINNYSNTASGNDSISENVSYAYTYNSDGYPASALLYDNNSESTPGVPFLSDKIIYVYK